jgi:hypothetical protein
LLPQEHVILVGTIQYISAIVVMTLVVLSLNIEPIVENWEYIRSGRLEDQSNEYLTKEYIALKNARLGNTNPLFVATKEEYFYYDDAYSEGIS